MTLSPPRTRAYFYGALTGAFTTLALVARGDPDRPSALPFAVVALCCGYLAVAAEERAQAGE